eukprot:2712526-Pleurochrysis_carterae.AAC.1
MEVGRKGGKRDSMRSALEGHYSSETQRFSRSFVVGPVGDMCDAAYGLAAGLSVQTFYQCRTDVRKQRPLHAG